MDAAQREKIAKALADPKRWRILELVRQTPGCSCGDVVAELGLSQPTVSHHIQTLCEAELLTMQREGTCGRLSVKCCTIHSYLSELSEISR